MKIVNICQSYPPMTSGAALTVEQIATGIAKKGHQVLVIAASDRREGYTTKTGQLRVERFASRHNPFRINQRFLLLPYRQIRSQILHFKPDVIHLHEPLGLGLCGLKIAKKTDIPVVVTLHQLPWFVASYTPQWWGLPPKIEWLLWQYGTWFLEQCEAHITPTETIASIVESHTNSCPNVISYGTDLRRFKLNSNAVNRYDSIKCKYGLDLDKPIILHVGRLDADKGVDDVIRAAAGVMKQVDAQLLVVGDGCLRKALTRLSHELGISKGCHFAGFVSPHGDLPAIYGMDDVFVTASEIETFGIVILEAMASGCPIVAVKATCIPELVNDECNGFLVQSGDENDRVEKTVWLL